MMAMNSTSSSDRHSSTRTVAVIKNNRFDKAACRSLMDENGPKKV